MRVVGAEEDWMAELQRSPNIVLERSHAPKSATCRQDPPVNGLRMWFISIRE